MDAYSGSETSSDEEAAIDELFNDPGFSEYMRAPPSNSVAEDLLDGEELLEKPRDPKVMTARAYQLEMLEASLKQNVIVAMDTGSGKTQVAILRIKAELDRAPQEKRVWMLAPTVALCSQHLEVLKSQIPSVQSKVISGADNVEAWSENRIWDNVLLNIRVVISTYQILFDALAHAFVRMDSLALLVLDEAHNCRGKHPGRRIMREFYHEAKSRQQHVPHVLGLTASPVISANPKELDELETTLDSVCKTPTIHRDELLTHVNRPVMTRVAFTPSPARNGPNAFTTTMSLLYNARQSLDIRQDPSILRWKAENTERSRRKVEDAMMSRDTYVQTQMRKFCQRSQDIHHELGPWPADYYIHEAIQRFLSTSNEQVDLNDTSLDPETAYMTAVLRRVRDALPPLSHPKDTDFSDKMHRLFNVLLSSEGDVVGIVFVKERATTAVLSHVLNIHPLIGQKYRVGTMVGTSSIPSIKQGFLDLEQDKLQLHLQNFRTGKTNLLVATSVLEEGIDVPACNFVICFDKPANLKVFIQRRGRARMKSSRLVLLHEAQSPSLNEWEEREKEMKRQYEDEMRGLRELEKLEQSEDVDYPSLYVESTGARLTIDDARSHLEHFCATLSSRKYVDWNPDYITEKVMMGNMLMLKATVILPISLPEGLRRAKSMRAWQSEANAWKDAAFQAYKALFNAGLVNNNLLPLKDSDLAKDIEARPGMIDVKEQFNPWLNIAHAWKNDQATLYRRPIRLLDERGSVMCELELRLPVPIPEAKSLVLYWDHKTPWQLDINSEQGTTVSGSSDVLRLTDHTSFLLSLAYCHRWEVKDQPSVLRFVARGISPSMEQIASAAFDPDRMDGELQYLIRDAVNNPYFYKGILPSKPSPESVQQVYRNFEESPQDAPYLVLGKWPKKSGFFHLPVAPTESAKNTRPYPRVLPAVGAQVDGVPLKYAQFGLLIPSIIHYFELYLVAAELVTSRLKSLEISNINSIVEAICATSAREPANYERIEFVGDSVLKLCVTVNISAAYLDWPEGLLSPLKDTFVSNSRLSKAAVATGLDQFIITRQLTLNKWRPPYVDDLVEVPQNVVNTRRISTKTLADVVEALIGISWDDGDFPKALQCISLFLPLKGKMRNWMSLQTSRQILFDHAPNDMDLPATMEPLEELLGYAFKKKSLLVEAMTHASYTVPGTVACFDRLEFLGDAILDYLVVKAVYEVEPRRENFEMHLLRTALVNGDILGFLVMEWSYKQQRFDVDPSTTTTTPSTGSRSNPGPQPTLVESEVALPLWSFMRFSSQELALEQDKTMRRHGELRGRILEALHTGTHYPWALLARLRAQKFFSDIFESLIGAVWVDSGSMSECAALLERAGILPFLGRILRDDIHILHPKEELGRLADRETVRYAVEATQGEEGDTEFACRVFVGERCVGEAEGAYYKEEARTKAAEVAVHKLKAERGLS